MKKILKKVAATILAASMVIGMTACGTGGGGSSTQEVHHQTNPERLRLVFPSGHPPMYLVLSVRRFWMRQQRHWMSMYSMWIRGHVSEKLPLLLSSWQQQDVRELSSVTHLIQR